MGRTQMGHTNGRMDGRKTVGRRTDGRTRRRLYAPPKFFGEHKKYFMSNPLKFPVQI